MTMILLIMNVIFLMTNHPLSMSMTLILQTIVISLVSGMMLKTFWISYILAITMLSGMLVIFIYMSSIASNEKFINSIKIWNISLTLGGLSLLSLSLGMKMIIKDNYWSMGMNSLYSEESIIMLNKLFTQSNLSMTIMMVSYLFLAMIMASHLTNTFEGPLRMKYFYA